MNNEGQIKNLANRNFPDMKKNSNKSYSLLPSYYHKINKNFLYNKNSKVIKNVKVNNQNNFGKNNNFNRNNCIRKNGLDTNKRQNINNYTINNKSKDIIYNNLYFSLNNSISNSEIQKNMKFNNDILNNNENDKFSTFTIERKNNLLKINSKNLLQHKKINSNKFNLQVLSNNLIQKLKVNIKNKKFCKNSTKNTKKLMNKYINTNNNINNPNSRYIFPTLSSENCPIQNNINNKTTKNNSYKKFLLKGIKNKPLLIDRCKTPNNYYSLTEINPIINMKNKNMINTKNSNDLNYIEKKKNILKSIEIEKQKLIDESYKNYKKYQYLIKKQQQECREYDSFLKKELNNNKNNQLKLRLFNNYLEKDGAQSYFNLVKKNRNLNQCLTNDIVNEEKKLNNNYFKYNKNTSLNKSIQKYFLLKTNDKENEKPKDKNNYIKNDKHNKNLDSSENKIMIVNKSSDINEFNVNIKILKNIQNKFNNNKIYQFKTKNFTLNKLDISPFNKTVKISKTKKLIDNGDNFKNDNNLEFKNISNINTIKIVKKPKKRLILKNKNQYINNIKEKKLSINNESLNYSKTPSSSVKMKSKYLSKLNELDDYIGPNQYGNLVIPPNHKKNICRMISEGKERTLKKVKKMFKILENKRNVEYYSQAKDRKIKDLDEYYKKKDFDKIILSSEKESKYNNIKNKIYSEVFKPIKYEFISNKK